ncbi:hypothetical protein [Polaribacter sp. Asnod1-A03]|uniref:hypothetical protein n=1 Tax=Polaribacter sp. Asnod1-A03 TaxID=3160581 RepID=UPI0038681578
MYEIVIYDSIVKKESTAKELSEGTIKYKLFTNENIKQKYFHISNKEEFVKKHFEVIESILKEKKYCFFHFDMHGNDYGLQFISGEKYSWKELLESLRPINIMYKNKLCVFFAVCNSASLLKSLNPFKESPFKLIVTSFEKIYEKDFVPGFTEFYTSLIDTFDPSIAIVNYNKMVEDKDNELSLITSDSCIDKLIELEQTEMKPLLNLLSEFIDENKEDNMTASFEKFFEDLDGITKEYKIDRDKFLLK